MRYIGILQSFFAELDLDRLYVKRPDPFIFLCGGHIPDGDGSVATYASLRDYVWRNSEGLSFRLVKAESALKLFQDSKYDDLIEFESDVALLSELVVLICEGSGSLAELGSFSSRNDICDRLYVIINAAYYNEDSFVMLGPVKKIRNCNEELVGALSWPLDGEFTKIDLGHSAETILQAINHRLTRSRAELIDLKGDAHQLILVYWICFVFRGATLAELGAALDALSMPMEQKRIQQLLYSMEVADWIRQVNIGSIYYVPFVDEEPFEYSYKEKRSNNASRASNFKARISHAISRESPRPPELDELIGTGSREVAV